MNKQINISGILAALFVISFSLLLIHSSWNWHNTVNEEMHKNCKMCSVFQKDCPYTNQEMIDEEKGTGPCSDMGLYEMAFKISLGGVFMGIGLIGIGITTIYSQIILNSKSLYTSKFLFVYE